MLVVLSPRTINSPWVRVEITKALEVEQKRKDDGYRVVPLLLPGVEPAALALWFPNEPLGIKVNIGPGEIPAKLSDLLAALGERLPTAGGTVEAVETLPLAKILITLSDPTMTEQDGTHRAQATVEVVYHPPEGPAVQSRKLMITAPLGPIEAKDLRWYLEQYYIWPAGIFRDRAKRIEDALPGWGQSLYRAVLGGNAVSEVLSAFRQAPGTVEWRISIEVDRELPEGTPEARQALANEAATQWLGLPWELLQDGGEYLVEGAKPVRVRRRLPNYKPLEAVKAELPIRILMVSPRPEDDTAGYIDHRASALPLVQAVEGLGDLVSVTVLATPTLAGLETALLEARQASRPYTVVHFDGHGIFDRRHGLGGLCFEDSADAEQQKLSHRKAALVLADKLAPILRDHRIPVVFLEACQSAKTEDDPTASVAVKLLAEGVSAVIAMSYSVLVETARRFVAAFYEALARGERIGGQGPSGGHPTLHELPAGRRRRHHHRRGTLPGGGRGTRRGAGRGRSEGPGGDGQAGGSPGLGAGIDPEAPRHPPGQSRPGAGR